MNPRVYRKNLSKLRAYGNVVESRISANDWGGVIYEKVPAKANMKYNQAFAKHDRERRAQYLEKVLAGKERATARALGRI